MTITFAHPYFFLFFAAIPLYVWFFSRKKNVVAALQLNHLSALAKNRSPKEKWSKNVFNTLRLLLFSSIIVALARPQQALREELIKQEGIDIMLAIDVSLSMLARDFSPNRLEVSKNIAISFVRNRPYDRIGLVTFSGEAFTQCPLTSDNQVVETMLGQIKTGFLQDGTAIGMGLATAVNRLKDSKAKSKVLILLTDGINTTGYIPPLTAAALAKELGVRIYTVAVGSDGMAMMPVGRDANSGELLFAISPVEIDIQLLQQIAQSTAGGLYFRANDEKELAKIYGEIDRLEKTTIESSSLKQKIELFLPFILIAITLLLINILLRNTIFAVFPN